MPDDDTLLDALDRLVNAPPPGDPAETLLTATHREYLRGKEPDLDPSTERTRRRTIRKRLRHSWIDTAVAFEGLAPEDCAQLLLRREGNTKPLQDYSDVDEQPGPPELFWSHLITGETTDSPVIGTGGLRQVFGLGFHSLYEALVVQSNWEDQHYEQVLEALVAESMRDALAKSGRNASIDVDIEIDDDERDELPAEIDSLEDLRSCFAHRQLQPGEYWEILDIDR